MKIDNIIYITKQVNKIQYTLNDNAKLIFLCLFKFIGNRNYSIIIPFLVKVNLNSYCFRSGYRS